MTKPEELTLHYNVLFLKDQIRLKTIFASYT